MGWLSVLPPLVAIVIVLWRKEVILALLLSVLTAEILMVFDGSGLSLLSGITATIDRTTAVFSNEGSTRVLIASLLVGALLAYLRQSGGVTAFVDMLINNGLAKSRRHAGLLRDCEIRNEQQTQFEHDIAPSKARFMIVPMLFLAGSLIAFSTGTS